MAGTARRNKTAGTRGVLAALRGASVKSGKLLNTKGAVKTKNKKRK